VATAMEIPGMFAAEAISWAMARTRSACSWRGCPPGSGDGWSAVFMTQSGSQGTVAPVVLDPTGELNDIAATPLQNRIETPS
jgi:hypothetical protein